jgi:hypothetical protein
MPQKIFFSESRLRNTVRAILIIQCIIFAFLLLLFPKPLGHLRVMLNFGVIDRIAAHDPALAAELRGELVNAIESMHFLSLVSLACILIGICSASLLLKLLARKGAPVIEVNPTRQPMP